MRVTMGTIGRLDHWYSMDRRTMDARWTNEAIMRPKKKQEKDGWLGRGIIVSWLECKVLACLLQIFCALHIHSWLQPGMGLASYESAAASPGQNV